MAILRKNNNILKFKKPASLWGAMWREGLPTGSGTVGASVLGGAGYDTIVINHNDLWWQGNTGVLPDVSDKLKATKTALDNGNYNDAENLLANTLIAKNYRPRPAYPLPLCDFKVSMPIEKIVKDYFRMVNMENGEITVSFRDKNTKYDRSLFISRVNDVICYQITKAGQKPIDCTLSLTLHDKSNNRSKTGVAATPDSFDARAEKGYLFFSARNDTGTDYGAVARVTNVGGSLTCGDEGIIVKGADRIMVYIKTFVDGQKEKEFSSIKTELSNIKLTYDRLLKEHASLHGKLFSTTELSLSSRRNYEYAEDMIAMVQSGDFNPAVVEKLYAYGKYLFVCSTSANGQPCNPYGLFNGDYKAEESTRNNYLQTQRLYNFALDANLSALFAPLLKNYANHIDDYKKNAMRLFACKGIYVPALEAPGSGLLGSVDPGVIMNFNVAALISQMMYEYWLRNDDNKMLKEYALEFIRETAYFYEDLLKVNKTSKMLESPLGYSPYNTPKNVITKNRETLCIASNCVIDFVCARQVFNIFIEVGKATNMQETEVAKWQELIAKIPDTTVDADGLINEYNSIEFETNHKMPHIPHLFPYNVGNLPFGSKRDYEKLVTTTCKARFNNCKDLFTSGSLVNLATALATTGDGNAAYEVLSTVAQSFITGNLVFSNTDWKGMGIGKNDDWAIFSIDKNTAVVKIVQNIFINANKESVTLFKNIPSDFIKGSLSGLVIGSNIKADIDFNRGRGNLIVRLRSSKNNVVALNLPEGTKRVKGVLPTEVDLEKLLIPALTLPAGKQVTLKIKWVNKI